MSTTWIPAPVRRRVLSWVVARKGMPDLTTLSKLPETSTYPLRRNGVDPVPMLAETRDAEPVTRLAQILGLELWLVAGYEESRAVLANTTRYSNDIRHLMAKKQGADGVGGLGMTDAPEHTRLRGLLTPEFTMRKLARLQPVIQQIVEETLDDLAARGPEVDLVPHFGFAIPFRVISDLLGLPMDEQTDFREIGVARFDLSQGFTGVFGAASGSRQFLIDAVARQREHPGDGLIAAILAEHGDEIDDLDLGGLIDGVFLGGYETSASMLAMGTYILLGNPDAYAALRSGDGPRVDAIVNELLRYLCPVQMAFPRFARVDHDLYGTKVKKGDVVLVSLSGANRDPRHAPEPERFDLANEGTAHLAFGHGLHRCVGSELARMELRAALVGLSSRFPDLALTGADLSFRELSAVFGIESLPVRLG